MKPVHWSQAHGAYRWPMRGSPQSLVRSRMRARGAALGRYSRRSPAGTHSQKRVRQNGSGPSPSLLRFRKPDCISWRRLALSCLGLLIVVPQLFYIPGFPRCKASPSPSSPNAVGPVRSRPPPALRVAPGKSATSRTEDDNELFPRVDAQPFHLPACCPFLVEIRRSVFRHAEQVVRPAHAPAALCKSPSGLGELGVGIGVLGLLFSAVP